VCCNLQFFFLWRYKTVYFPAHCFAYLHVFGLFARNYPKCFFESTVVLDICMVVVPKQMQSCSGLFSAPLHSISIRHHNGICPCSAIKIGHDLFLNELQIAPHITSKVKIFLDEKLFLFSVLVECLIPYAPINYLKFHYSMLQTFQIWGPAVRLFLIVDNIFLSNHFSGK